MGYIQDYHCEAGVHYRFIDRPLSNREIHPGECLVTFKVFHPKLAEPHETKLVVSGKSDQIYKLVNHWNRRNRLQDSQWYYEAP
jgi:hypothetical protein